MEPDSPLLREMCCSRRLLRHGSPKEGNWLRPGLREVSSTQDEWPVGQAWRTSVAGVGTALSWEFSNWQGQLLVQWTLWASCQVTEAGAMVQLVQQKCSASLPM